MFFHILSYFTHLLNLFLHLSGCVFNVHWTSGEQVACVYWLGSDQVAVFLSSRKLEWKRQRGWCLLCSNIHLQVVQLASYVCVSLSSCLQNPIFLIINNHTSFGIRDRKRLFSQAPTSSDITPTFNFVFLHVNTTGDIYLTCKKQKIFFSYRNAIFIMLHCSIGVYMQNIISP